MLKRPNVKADLFILALIFFLFGAVFSFFVLEKDPDARLGLFGISVWILAIVGAILYRRKTNPPPKDDNKP